MTDQTESTTEPDNEPAPPRPDTLFSSEQIEQIIEFHGTPVAAQALREVLGSLGRTAAWAARKRPNNRESEVLAKWPAASLRLLAELCATYAPQVGVITSPREAPEVADDGCKTPPRLDAAAQDASVAAFEAELLAERAAKLAELERLTGAPTVEQVDAVEVLREVLGAEPVEPVVYAPDPVDDAALAAIPGMTDALGWTVPTVHAPDPEPAPFW